MQGEDAHRQDNRQDITLTQASPALCFYQVHIETTLGPAHAVMCIKSPLPLSLNSSTWLYFHCEMLLLKVSHCLGINNAKRKICLCLVYIIPYISQRKQKHTNVSTFTKAGTQCSENWFFPLKSKS